MKWSRGVKKQWLLSENFVVDSLYGDVFFLLFIGFNLYENIDKTKIVSENLSILLISSNFEIYL